MKPRHPRAFPRHLALSATALLITTLFDPALAQEAAKQQQTAASAEQASASEGVGLESVTVSARRRTEKAQDVPAPISVVSGRELEVQRIYQVQDLQTALPNVTSQFLHARQSSLAVRGIGNNTANEGLKGSVGIYLDNVFLGRPGQAVFDLLDVEQADLLRGPQGTLFGKNSTGGVLNVTTRKPTFEPESGVEVSLGERNYHQLKAFVSGPATQTAAYRVSAYTTHDDGWVSNVNDGNSYNEINRSGARGQVLIKPDEAFNLRLIAEFNQERSTTGTLVPYSYGPLNRGTATNTPTNATTFNQWATSKGATNVITNPYDYKVNINDAQLASVQQGGFSGEANWNLKDGWKATSITAVRFWDFDPKNDLDTTNLQGLTGGFKTKEDQFSQEVRLASPSGKPIEYVVGGYAYHQNVSSYNHYESGAIASALYGNAYPSSSLLSGNGTATTDSLALFGQSTLHLNEKADVTGGLRYTSEAKTGHVVQNAMTNAAGSPVNTALSALPVFKAYDSGELSRTDNSWAGLLTGSYRFTPQVLGYVSASHGEKSGGYNVNSVASVGSAFGAGAITLRPETADNIEIGTKTTWLDNRLQANVNLFQTKIRDYQAATTQFYAPTGGFLQVLTNVGDLTSQGMEFDLKAQPTRKLTLNLNGAYTVAKFDSGTGPTPFENFYTGTTVASTGYGKGSQSIVGNWVNGSPQWSANASAEYRFRLRDDIDQYIAGSYSYRSETYGDLNNSTLSKIPAYELWNFATGWRVPTGENTRWDLSLWVKNVFDTHYFLGVTSVGNNFYVASAGQPRTIGASLRFDFF